MPEGAAADLRARLAEVLHLLRAAAIELREKEAGWFADEPPRLQFVTPLADGADQLAAEIAVEQGFDLQAVLPFTAAEYRGELPTGAQAVFDALLARSECRLELPGAQLGTEAYVMAGRATVAHCDLLIAVWDGLSPRGRGGTAEVVELAIARGTPVLHVPVDASVPIRLLWAAFDPVVLSHAYHPTAERPCDSEHVRQMLAALLLPPSDPQERAFLRKFGSERMRRVRARIEYPLLLAAAGVKRFGAKDMRNRDSELAIAGEWRTFRDQCATPSGVEARFDLLEQAYGWSDRLATHFAQTYRSGHIFNFVLGGIAVCLGLSGFMAPHARLQLASVEFLITLAIIINSVFATRGQWHRRWLDYRQLAERLRPLRSLKLLTIAAPDPPGTAANPMPRRWIDWYAAGLWRAMGCPHGGLGRAPASLIATAIADHELAPQVAYHERTARQIDLFDQRLERVSTLLFYATLLVCVAVVAGLALAPDWVDRWNPWFTLVSAGFPALGTAVFGIRFQGDFGGSARRSEQTAASLRQIEGALRQATSLPRTADLTEQAARTMLEDLDEWRLVNQQHDVTV